VLASGFAGSVILMAVMGLFCANNCTEKVINKTDRSFFIKVDFSPQRKVECDEIIVISLC